MSAWYYGAVGHKLHPDCSGRLGDYGHLPLMQSGTPIFATSDGHELQWHDTGASLLEAEIEAIKRATKRVLLERYIFHTSAVGDRFRDALVAAAKRHVEVVLVLDHVGSFPLPRSYFAELIAVGGKILWFNPVRWRFWIFRDHRKLLVVDDRFAFLGGCNIASEYEGDGVAKGWRDGGIAVTGPVVACLATAFQEQAARATQSHWKWGSVRSGVIKAGENVSLLLTRPGFRQSALRWMLRSDLQNARHVAITMAYFLPVGRMKRLLLRAAKRAASFRLLLPGKTDLPIIQVATRALYGSFQHRGAQIFEYQPQVLHAKLMVIDDIVYVGSANLDPRSLAINFELMLRIRCPSLAQQAVATFERDVECSTLVPRQSMRTPAGWWRQLKQRIARMIFTRLDPGLAQALVQKRAQKHGSHEDISHRAASS